MSEAKPFVISRWEVWEAYKRVKAIKERPGLMSKRWQSLSET